MSLKEDADLSLDTSDSDLCFLDDAMIESAVSSDITKFSELSLNNKPHIAVIDVDEFFTKSEDTNNSSLASNFLQQSVILAGSHKQNFLYNNKFEDMPESVLSSPVKPVEDLHKLHSPMSKRDYNKPIPQIVVTHASPQKSSHNFYNKRNIISPVAQYVRGNGIVRGKKIVFKNM